MVPDRRPIGAHLPLAGGMVKAVERAREIGASAIQVFSDNPTAWRRRAHPPRDLPAFRRRLAELGIGPLAIHASYLVNLAGPDEGFFDRSVTLLAHELRTGTAYGARFVNVHIGSHRGRGVDAGVARVAEGVARAIELAGEAAAVDDEWAAEAELAADVATAAGQAAGQPIVVLENSAGGGYGIGASTEELARIDEAIRARGVAAERFAFCLDTAHLWGAGHRISMPDEVDRLLADIDRSIGLGRVVMIHLNDSKAACGSLLDRHQHVGAGEIGEAGMGHIVRHPALAHVAYYTETPGMDEGYDEVNMARVRDLAAGRPLQALPPEALAMKGSRAKSAPADDEEEVARG